MHWQSLSFRLSRDHAEAFGDALLDQGAISVNVDDALEGTCDEKPIFGEPGADTGLWDDCRLTALFAPAINVPIVFQGIVNGLGIAPPAFELGLLEDEDWVQRNREQFQPIKISDRVWIVPTWHQAPRADALNIALDPGAAFGTGSHPTTRLCLQWLSDLPLAGKTVLDYGCGSGVLAMAASALGAASVFGVDIDPQAVETARFNTEANGLHVTYAVSDRELDQQYDVVVANILAGPLTVLAPAICAHVKPGGQLALAGILAPQIERIQTAYAPWITMTVTAERDGWVRMTGARQS